MPEAITLPEIVVVASRTESAASDSPQRVDVVSRTQIEQSGARDAGEILEEQPAVLVTRTFRGDAISLGGLDPEHTLVLVDGERLPGQTGGVIDLGRFGVESIERIEILRGPGSALYGSDAIAGVVDIVTRPPPERLGGDVMASGGWGQGSLADATGSIGGSIGRLALRANAGLHVAQPFDRDGSTAAVDGSGREQWSIGGRADYHVAHGLRLDVRGEYVQRRLDGTDQNPAGAVFDRAQLGEQARISVGERYRAGDTELISRFGYAVYREQLLLDQRGSAALDDDQDNRETQATMQLQVDQHLGPHRVSIGVDGLHRALDSQRLTDGGRRTRYSPYVQDEWLVHDGSTLLIAVAGARIDFDTQFGTQLSPRVGLRFDPVPDEVILRATYGLGFRAPTFQELLLRFENPSVGYVVEGNPDLAPERSRGLDAGVEWRPSEGTIARLHYFRNDVDDLIAVVSREDVGNGTRFTYDNVARSYAQGVDASVRVTPIAGLSLLASYTLLDTRDEQADRALEGRPTHRATLMATWSDAVTGLTATVRNAWTGPRPYYEDLDGDGTEETVDAASALQTDVRVAKKLFGDVEAFAGVDNVFDVGDAYLFVRPRTFYGGARARY